MDYIEILELIKKKSKAALWSKGGVEERNKRPGRKKSLVLTSCKVVNNHKQRAYARGRLPYLPLKPSITSAQVSTE